MRGPNGRAFCKWCKSEVPRGRICYCNDQCSDAYYFENFQSHRRLKVEKRDNGLCAKCGTDTAFIDRMHDMLRDLRRDKSWRWQMAWTKERYAACNISRKARAAELWAYFHVRWPWAFHAPGKYVYSLCRVRHFWEADHIIPQAEGGPQTLENLRTLCLPCHRAETKALHGRLALKRREQKDATIGQERMKLEVAK